MYNSIALCIHSIMQILLYLGPKHFITSKGDHIPIKQPLFTPLLLQALTTTNVLPVSMDFTILGILYKWNHIVYDLLCHILLSLSIIYI